MNRIYINIYIYVANDISIVVLNYMQLTQNESRESELLNKRC